MIEVIISVISFVKYTIIFLDGKKKRHNYVLHTQDYNESRKSSVNCVQNVIHFLVGI